MVRVELVEKVHGLLKFLLMLYLRGHRFVLNFLRVTFYCLSFFYFHSI